MYTVTRIMMSFTSLVTTFLCLMSFTACNSDKPAQPQYYDAVFKLPGYTREFVNEAWVDTKYGASVKLFVWVPRKGTDADAKIYAESEESGGCGVSSEVLERKVDERPIYIVREGCKIYDDHTPPIATKVYFEKDGQVENIIFSDDYYDHEEEIAEVVRTLRWVPQKNTNNEN